MIYLAERLAGAGTSAIAVAGVTSFEFLPLTCDEDIRPNAEFPSMCAAEFSRHGTPTMITSDDGTIGMKGLATDALGRVLDRLALPADRLVIYTCGPERMMRAVTELAIARSIQAWVAMERSMACGVGTCQSCVCKVRSASRAVLRPGQDDWSYKLVCTDGTIFDGRDIVW
jgi:dihydroorotate dehydrogenase electron transfer subunit